MGRLRGCRRIVVGVAPVERESPKARFLSHPGKKTEGARRRRDPIVCKVEAGLEGVAPAHQGQIVDDLIRKLFAAFTPSVISNLNVAANIHTWQSTEWQGAITVRKKFPRI